jgi:protein TonB
MFEMLCLAEAAMDHATVVNLRAGAARRRFKPRRGSGQAAGWVAALLLHGGLLAALIWEAGPPLPPPAAPPAVSLLVQAPAPPAPKSPPVAPRPPQIPARLPPAPTAVFRNSEPEAAKRPPLQAIIPKAAQHAAPAANVQRTPAPAFQGFVAAEPLGDDVNQPPEYPQSAVSHGEQGKVLLSIHVLPDGRTDFVSVTQSSGYDVLDQAAEDAVMQWRFQPASNNGQPVVMVIPFWIDFDLSTQSVQQGR